MIPPDLAYLRSLDFPTWPPSGPAPRHGVNTPIGGVRLSPAGKSVHREIKIRMDGPPARRWLNAARLWWLRNKGTIPPGVRVFHVDGNTLNDDPTNYALGTAGDNIAEYHVDHPAWSKRQHRRCAKGAARANRERAAAERLRRWLPSKWYPVDLGRRLIHVAPQRARWRIYAGHGVPCDGDSNGAAIAAAAVGLPGRPAAQAAALQCLYRQGPMNRADLLQAVRRLLGRYRFGTPRLLSSFSSSLVGLRFQGLITTSRRLNHITQGGRAACGRPCPIVAVRGLELSSVEFEGFTRVLPDERRVA